MIRLTQNDWRIFRRLQRKHKVSTEFLRYNLENIEKFIWFETWPRIVIRRYAIRRGNRVFIIHYRLRRVLFDQSNSKMFKRKRQNIKQWSKRVVAWQKKQFGIEEYVEEVMYEEKSKEKPEAIQNTESSLGNNEDVSKQLKEQLELLKNGRRHQSLITKTTQKGMNTSDDKQLAEKELTGSNEEKQKSDSNSDEVVNNIAEQIININDVRQEECSITENQFVESSSLETQRDWQINLESTPEKQITNQENIQPVKQLDTDEKTEKSHTEPSVQQTEKLKTGLNFLDMLMCKVNGSTASNTSPTKTKISLQRIESSSSSKEAYQPDHEHSMDSTDEFLGFDDCERIPGMLMTPIVPLSIRNNKNSVFVSESLNEYMRINDLETNYSIDADKSVTKGKIFARDMEGLMTPKTKAPHFDMPAVPENLLKFRTVAERKQYLQKFSKNYRLAVINNEACIYRELQRRMRTQKVKSASQLLTQSSNSSMSFTRNGWIAASFINTEFNKYYYQTLDVDRGAFKVRLRGARGNNDDFSKTPYVSRVANPPKECSGYCIDDKIWQYLKPIKTITEKTKKLNSRGALPSVFKPCPLSHKTFQKPLDDDTAALLLAGGSMAVVRMPTVELEVFPEYGKPLHEIAKRYLQYILPHHDISREWAEFSVSTLQQPKTLKEAELAAAKGLHSDLRKSYTFVIPYLNDRNHILVRRVVDRSEKLDESFEQCVEETELVPKTDFSFRQNLDVTDDVLLTCADVVSDMINTVAISCSENSFIKNDPDGLNNEEVLKSETVTNCKQEGLERPISSSPNATVVSGGFPKKPKKQNSLLLELKRLNATIIDAAVKPENDKKPCSRDYCQMGCICLSLKDVVPLREHCGKTKCMLECNCKTLNQSRIMRLETDGRTLTTEDAFMLRRKATARLARMEKEFTSTIVLTENETLLINETNNDKKRRCTKAPKRYEDFADTEDEQRRNSPKKTALTAIDKEKHLAIEIKEFYDPVYVKDSILEQLKHCTVNLVPLQDMDNIAHWCMVHNLYKCFCKGRAVEGKPMVIEKEGVNTTVEHATEQKPESDYNVTAKPKYTFDKVEKKKNSVNNNDEEPFDDNGAEDFDEEEQDENDDDDDWMKERKRSSHRENRGIKADKMLDQTNNQIDADSEENVEDECRKGSANKGDRTDMQKSKRSLYDVRKRFYTSRIDSCRRHVPTPRRMFLYCNRRRRLNVLKYIKENENDQTRILLNEHVMRSVYYHKIDIENHKISNSSSVRSNEKFSAAEKTKSVVNQLPQSSDNLVKTNVSNKKFLLVNEVVDLLEDEDEPIISSTANKNKDNTQLSSATAMKPSEKLQRSTESVQSTNHFQICSTGGVITVKKCSSRTDSKNTEQDRYLPPPVMITNNKDSADVRESVPESDPGADELKLPKIASCFSLNVKANVQKAKPNTQLTEEQCLDFSSATSVNSAAFSQNQNQNQHNKMSANALPSGPSGPPVAPKDASNTIVLNMDNENVRDVYNSVIKTMNTLVSKKMQDIDCALQRESHIIPTPNSDILCIMKWCNFLEAFLEGFAYIWQVKMKDATFFVVTIQNVMPLIMGAMGIVNIAALKAEKMPLMGKMLLQKFRNKETEKLAVVMQGKQSHWVIKGFLKADPNMACNKPTPESHPALTKKINILCSLLVKQRQKEQKKKEKSGQWPSPQVNSSAHTMTASMQTPPQPLPPQAPKIAQIMPTRRIVTIQPRTVTQNSNTAAAMQLQPSATITTQSLAPQISKQQDTAATQNSLNQSETESAKVIAKIVSRKRKVDSAQPSSLFKMDSYSKMSSNIEFRSVTQADIDEIFLPELHKLDHKWLVLDLHNDFSHIFVPDFRDLVSLDRIHKVINFARLKSKIVKLQFFQNAPFDAFVTPRSVRKIYFGPLTMDMTEPTLVLLQSVDGQMMLRELYQLQHNIVKRPEEKTKAFWLVHLKGQTHFEMDVSVINEKPLAQKTVTDIAPILTTSNKTLLELTAPGPPGKMINEEDLKKVDSGNDDEDCVIVEEPLENSYIKDTIANRLSQSNSLPAPLSQAPKANNTDSSLLAKHTQSLLKVPNTNTIITPLNSSNTSAPVLMNVPPMVATNKPLPILTLPPNTIITGITPSTAITNVAPAQIVTLPQTAIITGIESAPPEAPYSSTIFITSSASSSCTSLAATTTISTATIGNATVTSNSLANELRPATLKLPQNTIKQALEAGSIKRRRISLFCSNKYDKISENLAVDAVIRKILPDNSEDIQINQVNENSNVSPSVSPEVVATVGSTKISKVVTPAESNILKNNLESKAPIVFDVNFMDDGDEPTASIVIKPTSSTATSSTTTSSSSSSKPFILRGKPTNTSLITAPITSTSVCVSTSSTTAPTSSQFSAPPNKKIKLPTIINTTTAVTSASNAIVGSKTKIINSFLCTKQPNITPKFSTPKPIASKLTSPSSSSPALPSSPDNSATTTPFPFRRPPISLKVQKVISSGATTLQAVKPLTTTATVTKNQVIAAPTLTVKQVQDMLNKPCRNVAAINSTHSAPLAIPSPTMPIHVLPSIKATITPTKITNVSATSTKITPASSTTVSSACAVSSILTANNSITTTAPETNSLSATLTISKVQSFGSPQKPLNVDKNVQALNTTAQILISDLNDNSPTPTPIPPAHIQYGYIVSPSHVNQKFVAKRVAEEFYVKVPSVGILKLQGLAAVNNYLNKFINKVLKETQATPAVWQFAAASKAVQMQNHQKSLLVRKTKNTSSDSGTAGNRAACPNNSLEEPILIDD